MTKINYIISKDKSFVVSNFYFSAGSSFNILFSREVALAESCPNGLKPIRILFTYSFGCIDKLFIKCSDFKGQQIYIEHLNKQNYKCSKEYFEKFYTKGIVKKLLDK